MRSLTPHKIGNVRHNHELTNFIVQLSTHSSKIPKLQVFASKPFHVDRISCRIAEFQKKDGCLQSAVIKSFTLPVGDTKQKLAASTFHTSMLRAVPKF